MFSQFFACATLLSPYHTTGRRDQNHHSYLFLSFFPVKKSGFKLWPKILFAGREYLLSTLSKPYTSLASLDMQEFISVLIRLNVHDVNSIVSLLGNLSAKDKEKEVEVSPEKKGEGR
jgi:hypothetical protein